ncbi:MAG: glycosyltransferase family 2 protein [Candidatus Cloacimonetes bacterium]|nr:glycosyltransferase family 2 protein [Candidatus Cloacimonadota bacterium]
MIIITLGTAYNFFRTCYIMIFTPILHDTTIHNDNVSSVSILLPVRNEAKRVLGDCLTSLLNQDYPNYELVIVNDRSTDNSNEILQFHLHRQSCKKTILIDGSPLQNNWIGKTFALQQAKVSSTGEWLLMVDADVIFKPNAVSLAMDFAEKYNLDALSLLPRVKMISVYEMFIIPIISWLSLLRVSPTQANRTSSRKCFGYGNFILCKRHAHNAIGGFESYKSHILDDCIIMEKLKLAEYNVMVCDGANLMRSRMYDSLPEIINGFTKNSFAALNNNVVNSFVAVLLIVLLAILPCIFLAKTITRMLLGYPINSLWDIVPFIFLALSVLVIGNRMKTNIYFYLLFLIGFIVSIYIIVNSTFQNKISKFVRWKDRKINSIIANKQ